jgi:hypothetical protein
LERSDELARYQIKRRRFTNALMDSTIPLRAPL